MKNVFLSTLIVCFHSHTFTFLSLPLSLVQVLLWVLALATVAMVTAWKRITPQLWIVYNYCNNIIILITINLSLFLLILSLSVFVVSEYILSTDNVYPAYIAMSTGAVGLIMFWRYEWAPCTLVLYYDRKGSLWGICYHVLIYNPCYSTNNN